MLSLVLASALAFARDDAALAYSTATNLVACHTPRDAGTSGAAAAALFIVRAARAAGAEASLDRFTSPTPLGRRDFANVVCEIPSAGADEWIVFVSHYDTKIGAACPGANDGASTTGLLVALARALSRAEAQPVNIMLVWTDGEECMKAYSPCDGLWGSRHAASRLAEEGRKVRAVVCFDMLGDRDLDVSVPGNSSPELRDASLRAAKAAGLAGRVSAIQEHVLDDHVPFVERGFKAVDLIDFHYGSAPGLNDWWHTPHDTAEGISEDSIFAAGRLAVALVAELARPNRRD